MPNSHIKLAKTSGGWWLNHDGTTFCMLLAQTRKTTHKKAVMLQLLMPEPPPQQLRDSQHKDSTARGMPGPCPPMTQRHRAEKPPACSQLWAPSRRVTSHGQGTKDPSALFHCSNHKIQLQHSEWWSLSSPVTNTSYQKRGLRRGKKDKERGLCALCQPITFNRGKDTSGYSFL